MKSTIAFVICLLVVQSVVYARQGAEDVAVSFKQVTVSFHSDPRRTDAKILPLIGGKLAAGSKERFGLCLGSVAATHKVIDILDKEGVVIKSVSVGELLAARGSVQARRAEETFTLATPQGNLRLRISALASGDVSQGQNLIVTFALKSDVPTTFKIRVSLPVLGSIKTQGNGFILGPASGSAAIAASVYPGTSSVTAAKTMVTLTSGVVVLKGLKETAFLWLVLEGVGGTTMADASEKATNVLRETRFGESDPHIVVVSTMDKEQSVPGDTVTYTVICKNIGTAPATEVTLNNPVSEGMQFLEGSATSDGSDISFERAGPGTTGSVRNIGWKFTDPVTPGEERTVSFRVRIE